MNRRSDVSLYFFIALTFVRFDGTENGASVGEWASGFEFFDSAKIQMISVVVFLMGLPAAEPRLYSGLRHIRVIIFIARVLKSRE